jgi:hypothetical protein
MQAHTSQYFFKHSDRLHRHPMLWPVGSAFDVGAMRGLKALGFFDLVSCIAFSRIWANMGKLLHSLQLQPSQNKSAEKHSQYSLRHLDFLQLHGWRRWGVPLRTFSLPVTGERLPDGAREGGKPGAVSSDTGVG